MGEKDHRLKQLEKVKEQLIANYHKGNFWNVYFWATAKNKILVHPEVHILINEQITEKAKEKS